ncbi:uncharacterized protein LOC116843732 isoform X1 [Odontomachus brunneus]|uniref:uncharacterized protein LOC116843732 isoform X1 n=1 Tax=Odontomachus brunneus TaxID=486640 RepID=UPI0013F1A365|nr:uncharacterized protein LOC116843732 isoform X1 [Odontomachus brunneus]
MIKKAKKDVISLLDSEEDKDHSISTKLAAQEQRQKLLNQTAMLRTYVSVLENRLETLKFGQLRLPKPSHNNKAATHRNVPDVWMELRRDLYRFAGIQCVKCKGSFVFVMSSTDDVPSSDLYTVEILIDEHGCGKLGRWILPMSVDVQEILSQHPIDNLNNVRQFLKSCKQHVDCYTYRVKQLEELKNFVAGLKNGRVFHTIGIAQIELVMLEVKDIANDAVHNVTLYLRYNSAEVRPYKLLPDTDDNERPSADLLKRLKKHFKPFLKNDLISAFQQVSGSQTEFLWKPIAVETGEINLNISGESLENAGFLSTYFHRDQKGTKKRQKKSRNNEQNKSVSRDNETEMSLCVKGEQDSDVEENNKKQDAFPRDDKKVKPRKHQQSAKTTMKLHGAKKSLNDSRKFDGEIANVEKSNVADEKKKSEPKFTSATRRTQQRKHSKKRQMDTENAQIEDNTLSKDKNNHDNKKNSPRKVGAKCRTEARNRRSSTKSDTDSESAKSPRRARKQKKAIIPIDERDKEDHTITNPNKQDWKARVNVSSSTPFTKKLPDKRKFFHASRISDILQ